ncbi:uncharacterized protein LOC109705878 [Ananas comosus]|uniref:ATP-dependent DNA helicase n=1 Tax=Ananas comosus TaxID=4615 RepID=A0A6P5ELL5_ANACO|nr:uncharacterized protein LOC109705878 [Ananas comosus]
MEYKLQCKQNRKFRKSILDHRRKKYLRKRKRVCEVNAPENSNSICYRIASAGTSTTIQYHEEQLNLGLPEYMCQYCGALFWYAERIAKYRNGKKPIFSMCCQEGKITLELLHPPPQFLANLLQYKGSQESVNFRKNIRTYNSMFAFTSIGAKVDNEVNKKPGPYVFKISGQNYHRMGSLLPTNGQRPKFAQLYIYDIENEIDNRMRAFNSSDEIKNINRNIVRSLLEMFDCVNEIVKAFRMVRDRFRIDDYLPISLRLIGDRAENRPQYNPPSCSEIAGLIVGDLGVADRHRDIVVEHKTDGLKCISELHPSFMAMQYPILFPYGEDGFRIEERIDYIRRNQSDLRVELYKGIKDAIVAGDVDGDAFIPEQKAEDRPDIVSRVFKMKLEALMADIKNGTYFGKIVAEFQKRGLPHVHILVWLHANHKFPSSSEINSIISAEIPNKNIDRIRYETVSKFMIHGPCGLANSKAPCMAKGWCSKHFPKEFRTETLMDENGFAIYRRRDDGRYVTKNGINLDNRFVVPHNLRLIVKYQAHINVEWCNKTRLIKYLFKYVNKGPDRTRAVIEDNWLPGDVRSVRQFKEVDEIKKYLDCRYLSAYESVWRLFQFDIHCRDPTVERLTVHMPLMHNIVYHGSQDLSDVLCRYNIEKTMFTEWMAANRMYDDARELTYEEFPTKWVWHQDSKVWTRRKKGNRIGRVIYVRPNSGELYFLRMLLNKVKGPRYYHEIKTINGIVYETFRAACDALGLLGDDLEWRSALEEASHWSSPFNLRQLFVTLVMYCEVGDPKKLWDDYWELMSDDILYRLEEMLGIRNLKMPRQDLQNYVLFELELLFNKNSSSLSQFKLPVPSKILPEDMDNRLLREETEYDVDALRLEHSKLFSGLNEEQLTIYCAVVSSVYENKGGIFFVYGHGGTGKTYLWQTKIARLRSKGKIVLAVASSGIASLLLPGGRTAHSRFKIPIKLDDFSTCEIKKGTQLARLIQSTSLIIWDEAPMNHRNCFEALDRSLRDILCTEETIPENVFGGKTVVLGGHFRQILPVIVGGKRQDIVNASITKSYRETRGSSEHKPVQNKPISGLPEQACSGRLGGTCACAAARNGCGGEVKSERSPQLATEARRLAAVEQPSRHG